MEYAINKRNKLGIKIIGSPQLIPFILKSDTGHKKGVGKKAKE